MKTPDKDRYIEDLERHVTSLDKRLTANKQALDLLVKHIEENMPRVNADKQKLCTECGDNQEVIIAVYNKDKLQPLWSTFDQAYELLHGSTLRLRNTFKDFYSICEDCNNGPTKNYVDQ
jgi:hypothetical protein|tara:strand:- start:405 stop:761 length:357 start_codon:yes stop_codon:yes gene_type:complete